MCYLYIQAKKQESQAIKFMLVVWDFCFGSSFIFCRGLDIRVTEIMYTDSFYPTFLTATIHLVGKIIFRDRENSVIRLQAVILFEKVLHLVT